MRLFRISIAAVNQTQICLTFRRIALPGATSQLQRKPKWWARHAFCPSSQTPGPVTHHKQANSVNDRHLIPPDDGPFRSQCLDGICGVTGDPPFYGAISNRDAVCNSGADITNSPGQKVWGSLIATNSITSIVIGSTYPIYLPSAAQVGSTAMANNRYSLIVAAVASMGTFLYGFDTGIATTTIAHQSWIEYMQHPSEAMTGAVVATYIAGEAVGAILQILVADKLGRIRFMQSACVLVTIGCAIQTAAVNVGMFLAGRILAGIAVGALSGTVPIYISEISPPKTRGMIGGLSGVGLSSGTMVANWVGFACGYAPYSAIQWRLPLALQLPWGIIMFISLMTFMPNSPRQLIHEGKVTEARGVFQKIWMHSDPDDVAHEFQLMRAQIEYEQARSIPSYREIFTLYRRRVLVSISVQVLTSVTGINVVQYYQTSLYASLGSDAKMTLALAAVWGTCAFLANIVGIRYLADLWGRRKMLLAGIGSTMLMEIYSAVMQRSFQDSSNRVGKGFSILGIYLIAVFYYGTINSTTWLYGAEVLPLTIRSRIMGVAAASHYIVNVSLTEAAPSAFGSIHENYYYVFVACCAFYMVVIYFYYPETKLKTLEEIAAEFGDRVVETDEQNASNEMAKLEGKSQSTHIVDQNTMA